MRPSFLRRRVAVTVEDSLAPFIRRASSKIFTELKRTFSEGWFQDHPELAGSESPEEYENFLYDTFVEEYGGVSVDYVINEIISDAEEGLLTPRSVKTVLLENAQNDIMKMLISQVDLSQFAQNLHTYLHGALYDLAVTRLRSMAQFALGQ